MAVESISSRLVTNLRATGDAGAIALADSFEGGLITDKELFAAAGRFTRQFSGNASGALDRSLAIHRPSPAVSYDRDGISFVRQVDQQGVGVDEVRSVHFNTVGALMK